MDRTFTYYILFDGGESAQMNARETSGVTRRGARRGLPDVLILLGLALTVLFLMFRPSPAAALLPTSIWVYGDPDAQGQGAEVTFADLPTVTRTYDVLLKGETEPRRIDFTGTPLAELLKFRGDVDVTKVPFVKIRFGDTDASAVLVPLTGVTDEGPPPLILDRGVKPGVGSFPTPAIVPGQPGAPPITEQSIVSFDRRADISLVPAKEGAAIMGVRIETKKRKDGEYELKANVVSNSPGGSLEYYWYQTDEKGESKPLDVKGSRYTTKDARGDRSRHNVSVVVVATRNGSTGVDSFNYTSRKIDDGRKDDPGYGKSTGGSTGGTGGTGGNGGTGGTQGPLSPFVPSTKSQPKTDTMPSIPPPTAPTTTPEPEPEVTTDSSGIADIAQNYTTNAPMTVVNGVLLSSPTAPPSGGGGGAGGPTVGLTPLQQAAASLADSIFQPVEDPEDLWPYLVSLLFALGVSGGVREWINP